MNKIKFYCENCSQIKDFNQIRYKIIKAGTSRAMNDYLFSDIRIVCNKCGTSEEFYFNNKPDYDTIRENIIEQLTSNILSGKETCFLDDLVYEYVDKFSDDELENEFPEYFEE